MLLRMNRILREVFIMVNLENSNIEMNEVMLRKVQLKISAEHRPAFMNLIYQTTNEQKLMLVLYGLSHLNKRNIGLKRIENAFVTLHPKLTAKFQATIRAILNTETKRFNTKKIKISERLFKNMDHGNGKWLTTELGNFKAKELLKFYHLPSDIMFEYLRA
jgi:hypothetical protein